MAERFDADKETIKEDINEIIEKLKSIGAIEE